MKFMRDFDEIVGSHRVMVILRGMSSADEAVAIAERAWDAGVELVEIPIGDLAHVDYLAMLVKAGQERGKLIGAGTVISREHVHAAYEAGAAYTVAPGLDHEVLQTSQAKGLPHLPGVATPTEVQRARSYGCRWVKVFPAGTLGPGWFSAIRGPFPDMCYLATGGVTVESAKDYLLAGARVVAFGSAAVTPGRVGRLAELNEHWERDPSSGRYPS